MIDIPRAVEAGGAALATAMASLDGPLVRRPPTTADLVRGDRHSGDRRGLGPGRMRASARTRSSPGSASGPAARTSPAPRVPRTRASSPMPRSGNSGTPLVDGSILGLCLIVGKPDSADVAAALCREAAGEIHADLPRGPGRARASGGARPVGLEYRLVPLGSTPSHGVHFADILARVAMMFGGVAPGDAARLLAYAAERRARAMVIAFPGLSDEEVACVDALRMLGIPILQTGRYECGDWTATEGKDAVRAGMDLLGIRVTVTAIPIPMGCSPAFEGKSIRKEEMYVEFGGADRPRSSSCG